eukprot:CAMPEP_0201508462 /NCGR_PEP_ID=MMETSP0161_2-20130828/1832_1 /ASSEMBLY_ACC=CAM_ASM_000251 /TAXON_ID=180227 /ORGANISM="Neoparamoeba aestuarina, Strain SoJaBio B1-5/56/2" /LENGTH=221 /DNA_ID=CAMNT_0047903141 /DNA_START=150 /DNA_END=812 /DNA_ORIENTATION=-
MPEKVLVDRVAALEKGEKIVFGDVIQEATQKGPLLFNEHIGHCLVQDFVNLKRDEDFLKRGKHVFIFRDPEKAIPSLAKMWYLSNEKSNQGAKMPKAFEAWGLAGATPLQKLRILRGYEAMERFILDFEDFFGFRPVVIDADILLQYPEKTLDYVCNQLSLPFQGKDMMTWDGEIQNVDPSLTMWFETANTTKGFKSKKPATKEEIRAKGEEYLAVVTEEW